MSDNENKKIQSLTPKEIVAELDKYIIGQDSAKKSVAVALRNRYRRSLVPEKMREEIMEYCRRHIAKYALPREIEFRDELPKTLVGKVAYRKLEEEEAEKRARLKSAGTV